MKVPVKRVSSRAIPKLSFVVVNAEQVKIEPYLFVYVNVDGSARELHPSERKYLETPFDPFDGNRPYIKDGYPSKNGWGEITGFLKRSELPSGIQVEPAPAESPVKPLSKEVEMESLRSKGLEVVEHSEKVLTVRKVKPQEG